MSPTVKGRSPLRRLLSACQKPGLILAAPPPPFSLRPLPQPTHQPLAYPSWRPGRDFTCSLSFTSVPHFLHPSLSSPPLPEPIPSLPIGLATARGSPIPSSKSPNWLQYQFKNLSLNFVKNIVSFPCCFLRPGALISHHLGLTLQKD